MRLFWRKGRKIRSTERFKTSAILNARFRESYFKLKVNGRAVTSQTGQQPNVEVGFVWVSTGQPTWKNSHFESPRMKLLFSSWAFLYFPLVISSFSSLVRCVAFQSLSFCLLWLPQQARPHQGACLLLGVLFYFPNLVLFVSSYVTMKKFCSF